MRSLTEPSRWSLPTPEHASGCFETMRAYQGRIFRLTAHLERLYASANYLGVQIALSHSQLRTRLVKALEASGMREAIVRVAVIPACPDERGAGREQREAGRPNGRRMASPSLVVQKVVPPAPTLYHRGIRVAIVPTRKFPNEVIDPQAKYSARLSSVLATIEAQLRDTDEAIFMDDMGYVTESTASNLGMIKDGILVTPPCWLGLLAGITRQVLFELAEELAIPVREIPLTRHELYNADEALLSSTTKEILPLTVIDGRRIGTGKPGPYTRRLHRAFRQLVRRELRMTV